MNDPSAMERYCSSYYDKHGLYNDGFPCPNDKYCCQNADGTKMCCQIQNENTKNSNDFNSILSRNQYQLQQQQQQQQSGGGGGGGGAGAATISYVSSTHNSYVLNTISSNYKNFKLNNQQQQLDESRKSYDSYLSSFSGSSSAPSAANPSYINTVQSSSLPFLVTNSSLLISVSVGLGLVFLISIILICMCRCCYRKRSNQQNQHQLKNLKAKKIDRNNKKNANNLYSRNSTSSSCNSTTATSSTSTSPKTNEITVCCEDDEHQKILTIEAGGQISSHRQQTIGMMNTTNNDNLNRLMSNNMNSNNNNHNHNVNLNDLIIQQRNINPTLNGLSLNNVFAQSNYMNAISSGSSVCGSSALLLNNNNNNNLNTTNTTQSSYATNSQQLNLNENNLNLMNEIEYEGHLDSDGDFILSTSSNLEFLKAHSLFNTTLTPLNYYPSLNMATDIKNPLEEPPTYSEAQVILPNMQNSNIDNNNMTNTNFSDYRFSTFLPPICVKHQELI